MATSLPTPSPGTAGASSIGSGSSSDSSNGSRTSSSGRGARAAGRSRPRPTRSSGGVGVSYEWRYELTADHVVCIATAAAWRGLDAAVRAGAFAALGAAGAGSLRSAVEVAALVAFPVVVPTLLSASLRHFRERAYATELGHFFADVDPTQLPRVRRVAAKTARLGPGAPAAMSKRRGQLERKYGKSPLAVAAAAAERGEPPVALPGDDGGEVSAASGAAPATVRWGVLGTAGIARKNLVSIAQAAGATCVAVASRSKKRAEEYARDNGGIPRAYGSYEELLADADIDAVYVPLPTGVRKEWVLKAAAAGKHVLVEKPVGCTLKDALDMVEACTKHGVLLMDGVMFMHHDRLDTVRGLLDAGMLGEAAPTKTVAAFSFAGDADFWAKNIRVDEREPLGCLGDLGWYCVRFALWLHKYELPQRVCMVAHRRHKGIVTDCTCTLVFAGDRVATFDASFHHSLRQWVEVSGSKATLRIDDFVIPRSTDEAWCTVERWGTTEKAITFRPEKSERVATPGCNQHVRMIETFGRVATGGSDGHAFWADAIVTTQHVLDALVASASNDGRWVSMADSGAAAVVANGGSGAAS